jgi:hypothetical protein
MHILFFEFFVTYIRVLFFIYIHTQKYIKILIINIIIIIIVAKNTRKKESMYSNLF